jgi:type IV pilus assembly protein PilM
VSGPALFLGRIGRLLGGSTGGAVGVERGAGVVRISTEGGAPVAGASLRELVESQGMAGRGAAAMLEGNEVLVRRLTLPPMKKSDVRASLTLECRNLVGYPIEEAVIRHEVLGRSAQGPGTDVLVAVAPRRAVLETCRALEAAGLTPAHLTIRPVALRALLRSLPSLDREEAVAYLDLGPRESHISIFRGDEIRFTRECGVGVASFVDALRSIVVPGQGVRLLDAAEAESLLSEQGVAGTEKDGGREGGIPASAVAIMLRPSLERLVRELWNSIDYVHEQFQGSSVSRIALLGETARVPGLAPYLSGVLKMPVHVVDPGSGVADAALGRGAVAGLCLLETGAVDFLESAGAGAAHRLAEAIPQRIAVAAAAVLLLSISLPAELTLQRERSRVAGLEAKLQGLGEYSETVGRFREARETEARSAAVMAGLRGGTPPWSEVLRDLSHRVGTEARIVSLAPAEPGPEGGAPDASVPAPAEGTELRIEGLVARERLRPEQPLGELMASLERSPYVDRVELQTCQAVGPLQSRFVLSARLVRGTP